MSFKSSEKYIKAFCRERMMKFLVFLSTCEQDHLFYSPPYSTWREAFRMFLFLLDPFLQRSPYQSPFHNHLRGPQTGPASIENPHTCRRQPGKTPGHRVSELSGPGPNLPTQQTPTALPAARPSWLEIVSNLALPLTLWMSFVSLCFLTSERLRLYTMQSMI